MTEDYTALVVREFRRLKELADRAMTQLADEPFFAMPAAHDNSVAITVKHVAGNLHSRWRDFLTSDGEKPDRNRDEEFVIHAADSRAALTARWDSGWDELFGAIEPLGDEDMARTVTIRGEPLTVLQAINRQLSHYAYHVGQIVYVARHYAGDDWRSLSIAKGGSAAFNEDPASYLDEQT